MQIDLHGYHHSEIVFKGILNRLIQQCWKMGETELTLIHGHGRHRGIFPGFVNTNTGYFGLYIRVSGGRYEMTRRFASGLSTQLLLIADSWVPPPSD